MVVIRRGLLLLDGLGGIDVRFRGIRGRLVLRLRSAQCPTVMDAAAIDYLELSSRLAHR